jgi:hypothetical protein
MARAARIGSWMLNVKAADDPEAVLRALWPRLQALAVEPARDEADHVERSAFQLVAFEAQYLVRGLGLKPNAVVPGWDEHFIALVRENSRAANARAAAASVEGRLERRRQELFAQGADLAVLPRGRSPCLPRPVPEAQLLVLQSQMATNAVGCPQCWRAS